MRIGGGSYRGRNLLTPRGDATRPTSGLVRETLFNIIAQQLPDARFLDLFAGSGSVGLEALSRGAASAVFIERARPPLDCLRENIAMLKVANETTILPYAIERGLEYLLRKEERFDIIFLDPPFANARVYLHVLEQVHPLLNPDGIVIAQHDARNPLPDTAGHFTRYRLREIGDNVLSFYRLDG